MMTMRREASKESIGASVAAAAKRSEPRGITTEVDL